MTTTDDRAPPMDLEFIKMAVSSLERTKHDPATSHFAEDDLRDRFIEHVAEYGPADLAEMARELLKTDAIEFPRRYV